MEGIGTCKYCGQTAMITTVGEVSQAELDCMATDRCMCQEAQSERRKKERTEKVRQYSRKTFEEPLGKFICDAFQLVDDEHFDGQHVDDVTIKTGAKSIKIWRDSDLVTHIKTKRTEDEEFKV